MSVLRSVPNHASALPSATGANASDSRVPSPGEITAADEESKRVLRAACEHHKRGQTGVAIAIGMKPKAFAKRLDPQENRSLTIGLLALIALKAPRVAESFLERFAEAFRPSVPESPLTIEQLLHRAHVELSDVDRELLKAGTMTPERIARLRVEARESREAAEAIERKLAQVGGAA